MNQSSKKSHIIVAVILFVIAVIFLCYGIYMIDYSLEYIRTYMEISTISFEDALQYVVSSSASYIGFAIVIAIGGFIVFSLRKTHYVTFGHHNGYDDENDEEEVDEAEEEVKEIEAVKEDVEEEEVKEVKEVVKEVKEVKGDEESNENGGDVTENESGAALMPDIAAPGEKGKQPEGPEEKEKQPEEKEAPEKDLVHTREFSFPKKPAITYEEVMIPQEASSAPRDAKKDHEEAAGNDTIRQEKSQAPQQADGPAAQANRQASQKAAATARSQTGDQDDKPQQNKSGQNGQVSNAHLDTDSWLKDFFADK